MKTKKFIGFIVAASLAVGTTATFAQDQSAGSQPGQDQSTQAQPGQAQDQQSQQPDQSQIQQDNQAQPQPGAALNEPAGASTFDKEKFVKETAQGNMAELNIAQLATQKAQDPQIKEFAQKLVTDHSKVGDELKELAQKKNITLSTEVDPKAQKTMDHLSGLSGAEFDKAFTQHMARDHKKDVAMFKKAASNADDMEIRDFAKNTLPALEDHLRTVQQWAPEAAAGAEVQEPAGAEKKPDDANKDQQNLDQNQPQPQSQDQQLPQQQPDQNQSPNGANPANP